jgi:hypothetical protein
MYLAMEAHLDGYKVGLYPPDGSLALESPVARGDEKLLQEALLCYTSRSTYLCLEGCVLQGPASRTPQQAEKRDSDQKSARSGMNQRKTLRSGGLQLESIQASDDRLQKNGRSRAAGSRACSRNRSGPVSFSGRQQKSARERGDPATGGWSQVGIRWISTNDGRNLSETTGIDRLWSGQQQPAADWEKKKGGSQDDRRPEARSCSVQCGS